MNKRCVQNAMACIGAVIGAGFASGREVVTFFARYGAHSWWLIMLTAAASTGFCALLMRAYSHCGGGSWHGLYVKCHPALRSASRVCVTLLVVVVSGAMLSASGHMVELVWASDWAYSIGLVATLLLAWRLGFGSLKPLAAMSWALTAMLVAAAIIIMRVMPPASRVSAVPSADGYALVRAALRAVAYAAMNITIAIGVVCGCGERSGRAMCRTSALFGFALTALLFISNCLYLPRADMHSEAFPIVKLLSGFGRVGYIGGAALLYMALFTTLIALMRALRGAVDAYLPTGAARPLAALGLPMLMSLVGFARIVEELYAPIGYLCIAVVLVPLALRRGLVKSS